MAKKSKQINPEKIKFEEGLEKLEDIISDLEKGEMGLEDSIASFQEGTQLYKALNKKLDAAEGEVKILLEDFEKEA